MANLSPHNNVRLILNCKSRFESRIVCLPVNVYSVIAPKPTTEKLNIFQNLVLKLNAINITSSELLVKYTGLQADLISLIKRQLFSYKLVNEKSEITLLGKSELEGNMYLSSELIKGYVFQDYYTGAFFPQFSSGFNLADLNFEDGLKYPLIIDDFNKKRKAFWIDIDKNVDYGKIDSLEIIKALNNYKIALMSCQDDIAETISDSQYDIMKDYSQKVVFIEKKPSLYYLGLEILYDEESRDEWAVLNPFEFKHFDNKYKTILERLIKNNKQLEGFIALKKILSSEGKNVSYKSDEEISNIQTEKLEYMQLAEQIVGSRLIEKYGNSITNSDFYERVVKYLDLIEDINLLDHADKRYRAKLRDVALNASHVMVIFMLNILPNKEFLLELDYNAIDGDDDTRRMYMELCLKNIGYNDVIPAKLYSSNYVNKVKRIPTNIDESYESERCLLILTILAADADICDEFKEFITLYPFIIPSYDKIIDLRNRASEAHVSSRFPNIDELSIIKKTIDTTIEYYFTKISKREQ